MLTQSKMPLDCRPRLNQIRQEPLAYSQCWEDADVLLTALSLTPENSTILSVISGGENTLALLALRPKKIIAVDNSLSQIFCLQLKMAAFAVLSYEGLLEFIGVVPSSGRAALYTRCRKELTVACRTYWDGRLNFIKRGILNSGRLDRYFSLFRSYILPLVHSKKTVHDLLLVKSAAEREKFFKQRWSSWRWCLLFSIFFSPPLMALLGRDPAKFKFVEENWAAGLSRRLEYGLTAGDSATNPYLNWILTGSYGLSLPFAYRRENYELIKKNLHCIEIHNANLYAFLKELPESSIGAFNLSNVFEYTDYELFCCVLNDIAGCARIGAWLVYWNMMVKRDIPEHMHMQIRPDRAVSRSLYAGARTFFYGALHVAEVCEQN